MVLLIRVGSWLLWVLLAPANQPFLIPWLSYVTQEDYFLGTLTVRETIAYSAQMRFPDKMSKQEINKVVEKTIEEMGLEDCANTMIGNWHMRGISNGEKKRLSISIEILTRPYILFLDEPTSGLDSASAFFVIQALRNIACDGKIVICSIHQPSSDLFNLFDDLLLLSNGETVYFGQLSLAVKFFADAGFPCPTRRNPSDHFLRCISLDFDTINEVLRLSQKHPESPTNYLFNLRTSEIRAALIDKYKSSQFSLYLTRKIQEMATLEKDGIERNNGSKASVWKQLCTMTHRSFVNMHRDMGYYWLRILLYIMVAISIGTLYFHVGEKDGTMLARVKVVNFIYGFMICLSNGGLPFFIEEMKVSRRERLGGHYGEAVFVLSNFFSSFPYLILIALCSGTTMYFMVKFRPGFSHYAFFCLNLFCCVSVIESIMMIVASLVPNVLMGIGTGTGAIVLMMMASEISRPLDDLPKIFWRYPMSYLSFATWAIQGQYKNDMVGLEFESLIPGKKMKGEVILETLFGVPTSHSKWWDLTTLMFLLVAHRIFFYLSLKYKNKVLSLFSKSIHTRRTLNSVGKRVVRVRNGFASSKRHQQHPLQSLASQEGLRSPIT
ncbi:ABC transporter G family member 15-like isoform X2 [Mercurialis annua]|uniref:ABC transporter G family member 15-like isoform X2 n=1 Tax=Mercurialis annua TaxID=3986 RepID=UPI00216095FA|nr:ABC transporter G family member 15-like isoform X2 [Mercurialis annua]